MLNKKSFIFHLLYWWMKYPFDTMTTITDRKYYQAPLLIYSLIFIVEHYVRAAQVNIEKFNIDYSTKNIAIPWEREYTIQLISKVEKFIQRMRWKALQLLRKLDNSGKENYGKRYLKIVERHETQSSIMNQKWVFHSRID